MLSEVYSFITDNGLAKSGDRILLTVSGGIDSMVMADIFQHLPFTTAIAHCNFSLRGRESDDDEKLVSDFCTDHCIPFYSVRFDTKSYAINKGLSIQMAARELRYDWFESIRLSGDYHRIAVAHNLNDNIETVLINLFRGTGLTGLSGMKPVSGSIIRPLLCVTREKINEYCISKGVKYREDSSNSEVKYTRNKIRHLVLPVLKELNPSIEKTLLEASERFGDINTVLKEYVSSLKEKITRVSGDQAIFDGESLESILPNKTLIFELFRNYGVTGNNVNDLINVIKGQTGVQLLTGTHRIIRNRGEIIVAPNNRNDDIIFIFNNIDEVRNYPGMKVEQIPVDSDFEIPSVPSTACFDNEKIVFPLKLRSWRPGDHFFPLGMNHPKKLSDYFIDRKYSLIEKERKRVLESEGKIAWIVGDRIDHRFRITGSTRSALLIQLVQENDLQEKDSGQLH